MTGLIWIQTVCIAYQQTALVGKELVSLFYYCDIVIMLVFFNYLERHHLVFGKRSELVFSLTTLYSEENIRIHALLSTRL